MIREVQRFGLAPNMTELERVGSGGNKSQNREQSCFRSHCCLLVLSLDHLVMLATAQVVSQFLVIGLGSSMFGCVALKDKHLSEAHRTLSDWFNLKDWSTCFQQEQDVNIQPQPSIKIKHPAVRKH